MTPGADEVIAKASTLDYGKPGKPSIDWDDPQAKEILVSNLVNDPLAELADPGSRSAVRRPADTSDHGFVARHDDPTGPSQVAILDQGIWRSGSRQPRCRPSSPSTDFCVANCMQDMHGGLSGFLLKRQILPQVPLVTLIGPEHADNRNPLSAACRIRHPARPNSN